MKKILYKKIVSTGTALLFLLAGGANFAVPTVPTNAAAVPTTLSYQGRLSNTAGDLLGGSGTTYYFKFSIWNNPTVLSGSQLWPSASPTLTSATVRQGVFNVNIGDTGAGYPDTLNYDFSQNTNVYLQVEVSSDGSSFQTLSPRQRIASSAFSQTAGSVSGTNSSFFGATSSFGPSVVSILATSTSAIPLSIRAATGQTANLVQIQDSIGGNLFFVNASGAVFASSTLLVDGEVVFGSTLNAGTTTVTNLAVTNSSTSTFSGGLSTYALNITGVSTSTFANGIQLASGCFRDSSGSCISGGGAISSVSNSDSTLTISPTTGAVIASLNLGKANAWTGLQQFSANASSTQFSVNSNLYVGGSATTTIVGDSATSTFSGGLTLSSGNINLPTNGVYLINNQAALLAGALGSSILASSLTSVGALNSGSITSGFGSIDTGADNITTTGLASFGTLSLTGSTTLQNFTALNATSTNATSTSFQTTTLGVGNQYFTNLVGTGLQNTSGALTLNATGDWTGTFDGQEGSYYLDARNLTNFGTPFYTYFSATTTTALAEGTNLYWTPTRFDNRLSASSSISGITTLPNLALPSSQVSGLGTLATLSSVNNSNWSGTQLSVANGGTGVTSFTSNSLLYSNAAGTGLAYAATSTLDIGGNAGTVTNGVYTTTFPTLFDNRLSASTSIASITTLANLSLPITQTTGTLAVNRGGTGQTSFGQGWLHSDGSAMTASTSPTVAYITATSTSATSTFSTGGLAIGGSQFVVQQNSGRVGIGTTAPTAKLEINNTDFSYSNLLKIGGRTGVDESYGLLVSPNIQIATAAVTNIGGMKVLPTIADNIAGIEATNYRGIYVPVPSSSGTVTNAYGLYVDAPTQGTTVNAAAIFNGSVGIGTTTPYAKFSVSGRGVFEDNVYSSYFTATSTSATSTLPNLSATNMLLGSDYITDLTGTGLQNTSGALTLNATGDWTGTFDGQEGSYYLDARNLTNFGTPFYSFFSATNTDALTQGSTNKYWSNTLFDNRLSASTSIASITTLANLSLPITQTTGTLAVNRGGTGISSTPSYGELLLGNASSGYTLTSTSSLGLPLAGDLLNYLSLSSWFSTTTDVLDEGTNNLYFTNTRADNRAIAVLSATTSVASITTLANLSLPITQTTGTLAVNRGGTGQTSFGQGWLHSDGSAMTASTSPTVAYITATSTSATSTFSTGGLAIGGSQFVVQQNSGYVGVGTTSPYAKFSVDTNLVIPQEIIDNQYNFVSSIKVDGNMVYDGQINNAYGLYTSVSLGNTGSILNGYGLYVDNIAGDSSYGIYQKGVNNLNYFAGKVGIATTSPWRALSVYGSSDLGTNALAGSFTATSTSATSTLPNLSATNMLLGSDYITDLTGTGLQNSNGALTLNATGDWTGTFDGQEGSYYLDARNLTNFGSPFYSFFAATTTTALAEGTNLYWTPTRFDNRLSASSSIASITTLANLSLPITQTTGTLAVNRGGTGQTSFGQGWLHSDGSALSASTSPTVAYITATSTTATSTFGGGISSSAIKVTGSNIPLTVEAGGAKYSFSDDSGGLSHLLMNDVGGGSFSLFNSVPTSAIVFDTSKLFVIADMPSGDIIDKSYDGPTTSYLVAQNGSLMLGSGILINASSTDPSYGLNTFTTQTTFNQASSTLFSVNSNLYVGGSATTTIVGDSATSTFSGGLTLSSGNVNLPTNGVYLINNQAALTASALGSSILASSLTSVGALNSGSITSGFGAIDTGADNITTTGTGSFGTLNATGLSSLSGGASTTLLSALDQIYIGRTATSTLQGSTTGTSTLQGFLNVLGTNSTSTFSGGLAANTLGITSTTATSTFSTGGLAIGGSQFVVQQNSGRVGIGTASPTVKLQIETSSTNGFKFTESGSPGGYYGVHTLDNVGYKISSGSSLRDLELQVNNSTGLTLINGGNVGIGTTTPAWNLQVAGTRPSFALSDTAGGTNKQHWLFSSMGGNLYVGTSTDAYATSTPSALSILNNGTFQVGTSSLFSSGVSGYVGFGTTTPATRLHVSGLTGNDVIRTDMGLDINPVVYPSAPTIALVTSSGNVDAGTHYYYVTYVTALGETQLRASSPSNVVTDASHAQVTVTLPVSSDYRVTARRIYRTIAASGSSFWQGVERVATVSDNTTTSYTDNIADASLTGTNYFYQDNTTSKQVTINGTQAAIISTLNTVVGSGAGATILSLGTSSNNTLFGLRAGDALTTGSKVVAIGEDALGANTTGTDNVAVGWEAAQGVTTGSSNVAIGRNAMVYNQTGGGGTLIGYFAGSGASSQSHYYNTGIGYTTLTAVTTGGYNSTLGAKSGAAVTTGARNILLGYQAGDALVSGSNNIIIGYDIDATSTTAYGSLNIGALIFGTGLDGSGTGLSTGSIGIGTTTPWRKFSVTGTVGFDGLTTNTGAAAASLCLSSTNEVTKNTDNETCLTSSLRFKENVNTLPVEKSLATLSALRPVSFEYIGTPGLRYGLIAEEVDAIDKTLVGYDKEGRPNSVRYISLVPLLVQGFQDLSRRVSEMPAAGLTALSSLAEKVTSKLAIFENLLTSTMTINSGGEITVPAGVNEMAGEGMLPAGQTSVFVANSKVASTSQIIVTPAVALSGSLAVTEKREGEGFTLSIKTAEPEDVPFDYLIIQTYGRMGRTPIISPTTPITQNNSQTNEPAPTVVPPPAPDTSSASIASTTISVLPVVSPVEPETPPSPEPAVPAATTTTPVLETPPSPEPTLITPTEPPVAAPEITSTPELPTPVEIP